MNVHDKKLKIMGNTGFDNTELLAKCSKSMRFTQVIGVFIILFVCSCKSVETHCEWDDITLSNNWYGGSFYVPKLDSIYWSSRSHAAYRIIHADSTANSSLRIENYILKKTPWVFDSLDITLTKNGHAYIDRHYYPFSGRNTIAKVQKGEMLIEGIKHTRFRGIYFTIYKLSFKDEDGCWTFYVNDNLGLLKQYGSGYMESFEKDTQLKSDFRSDIFTHLLAAIKNDTIFHTRCDGGVLW